MSTNGCLYRTRHWPPFLRFSRLYPRQEFMFQEPPQLPFPLTERMRWHVAKASPSYERSSIHSENLSSFFRIEKM
jgi:hypothetical protein